MSSTDDAPETPEGVGESFDDTFVPPTVRRSTYTPPVARTPVAEPSIPAEVPEFSESIPHDDSAENPSTTSFPGDDADHPETVAFSEPVPTVPNVDVSNADVPPVDMPSANVTFSDVPAVAEPAENSPFADSPFVGSPLIEDDGSTATAPPPPAAPPAAPPVMSMTPEEQAAALALFSAPVGLPWTPERRSLPDSELMDVLESASGSGGTLEKMQELEEQLRLREEESREYQEWEESMLAVGTPEAIEAVNRVRPSFAGLVTAAPTLPSEPAEPAVPPVPDSPAPFADDAVLDAPPPSAAAFTMPPPPSQPVAFDAPPPPPPLSDSIVFDVPPPPGEPAFDLAPPLSDASLTATQSAESPELPDLVEPPTSAELPEPWVIPASTLGHLTDPDTEVRAENTSVEGAEIVDVDAFDAEIVDAEIVEDTEIVEVTDELQRMPLVQPTEADGVVTVEPGAAILNGDAADPEIESKPAQQEAQPETQPETQPDAQPEHALKAAPAFSIERAGVTPTPTDQRVGRAARMFWLWFAANSSIVSIGFGATLFSLGMSLRQAIVSTLIGVALSCLPLGLGTLAGKRSGQPTIIVSRAAFGVVGNIVPAILALLTRVFWGAVLLWLAATSTAFILIGAELGGPLSYDQLVIVGLAVGFVLAIVVAFFGYSLLAKFQLVVSVVASLLIVGLIVMTWPYVDLRAALTVSDGNWILVITGVVLVFSFIGLVWAFSSADLARYQRSAASGAGSMLWGSFGATVPTFVLIAYGAVLAASNADLATGLVDRPLDVLAGLLPVWYPIPLILVTVLSLLSGIVISLYSAGFALQGVGVRLSRQWTTLIVGLLVFFVAWVLSILDIDLSMLFRDVATTLAVPVAAWVGIFAADTMIRKRRYHSPSLLATGGVYPIIHWVNLPMLLVISGIGYAFTTATVSWLTWQGYGFGLVGVPLDGELAATDFGVLVALVLGIVTPIVAGIPGIRKQESASPPAN